MSSSEIDQFTSERVLEAAARGETVTGHEDLGEVLTALHLPLSASEPAAPMPKEAVVVPSPAPAVRRITRRTGVAAAVAVLGLSGVAAAVTAPETFLEPIVGADESEEDASDDGPEDTVFNFGYDEGLHLFVWNTTPTEGQYDCSLENGPLHLTYGAANGEITVDELADDAEGEQVVTFPDRHDEDGDASLDYGPDSECALNAAGVAGPNGQINHGMFMKLFNSVYEGTGRGCVVRHLAQSDLGKGDQQIQVSEVDTDFVSVMEGDTGVVDFETVLADCERGNGNGHRGNGHRPQISDASDEESNQEGGRPESPGRSGDAPGRNK